MNLSQSDSIEVITSASCTVHAFATYAADTGSNPSLAKSKTTVITTAATTAIADGPASGTSREVTEINIRNKGAGTVTITVQFNPDSGSTVELYKATLLTEGLITWTKGYGWATVAASSTLGVTNTVILAQNVANSADNTAADITSLGFTVEADVAYEAEWIIPYTAAATTTGARFMVNGPANPTKLSGTGSWPVTATTRTLSNFTAYDIPAAASTDSLTAGNIALLTIQITPSLAGTVIARFASEINGSAITALAGATLKWRRLIG